MADFEVSLLIHILSRDLGYSVISISEDLSVIKSASGLHYTAHKKISDVQIEETLGIIIPGGWMNGVSHELINLIKKLNANQKFIAGICSAPWIIAKSGIMSGTKFTSSISEWDEEKQKRLCNKDPFEWHNYVNERIVRDKNIITAKGIAFIDFSVAVCDYLGAFKNENEKKSFIQQFFPR